MTAAAGRPDVVKVSGPGDLAAALPHLVGFAPTQSIVVITVHGPRKRMELTMRFDLLSPDEDVDVASMLAARARQQGADAVYLAVVTEDVDGPGGLPRQQLVDEFSAAVGVPVVDALLVRAGRWWSYLCADPRCCPADGTPVDPGSRGATALAAANALQGRGALADREAVVQSLAPLGGLAGREMQQALDAAWRELSALRPEEVHEQTLALVDDLVERCDDPRRGLSAPEAARVVLGVDDDLTRDALLGRIGSAADTAGLQRVMRDVARRVLPPLDAPVCSLLGWLAYSEGDGLLANVALERALSSDPSYPLAMTLEEVMDDQVHPSAVRAAMQCR